MSMETDWGYIWLIASSVQQNQWVKLHRIGCMCNWKCDFIFIIELAFRFYTIYQPRVQFKSSLGCWGTSLSDTSLDSTLIQAIPTKVVCSSSQWLLTPGHNTLRPYLPTKNKGPHTIYIYEYIILIVPHQWHHQLQLQVTEKPIHTNQKSRNKIASPFRSTKAKIIQLANPNFVRCPCGKVYMANGLPYIHHEFRTHHNGGPKISSQKLQTKDITNFNNFNNEDGCRLSKAWLHFIPLQPKQWPSFLSSKGGKMILKGKKNLPSYFILNMGSLRTLPAHLIASKFFLASFHWPLWPNILPTPFTTIWLLPIA